MVIKSANINIEQILTKEQVAYDEALKNMRYVTAILKISQEGVNIDDISQDKLDTAIKLFDEMDIIQRDFNVDAQKIQQDFNNTMRTLQESANKKFGDVQNRYRKLIESINGKETVEKGDCSAQSCDINMSKEREEAVRKSLMEELERAQDRKT